MSSHSLQTRLEHTALGLLIRAPASSSFRPSTLASPSSFASRLRESPCRDRPLRHRIVAFPTHSRPTLSYRSLPTSSSPSSPALQRCRRHRRRRLHRWSPLLLRQLRPLLQWHLHWRTASPDASHYQHAGAFPSAFHCLRDRPSLPVAHLAAVRARMPPHNDVHSKHPATSNALHHAAEAHLLRTHQSDRRRRRDA